MKVPKTCGFTMVENATVRDKRLTFRATGLLVFLLSLPDGASIDARGLAQRKGEGRDAILRALRELTELGYLHRRRRRVEGGRFVTETYVLEQADLEWQPGTSFQDPEDQDPEDQAFPTGKTSCSTSLKTGGNSSDDDTRSTEPASSSDDFDQAVWVAFAGLVADDKVAFTASRDDFMSGVIRRARRERKGDLREYLEVRPNASPDDLALWLYGRLNPDLLFPETAA